MATKLWRQAAELQRTADFLAVTGLRILHGHHIESRRRRRKKNKALPAVDTFAIVFRLTDQPSAIRGQSKGGVDVHRETTLRHLLGKRKEAEEMTHSIES